MSSAILYVAIVVIWACVLIPRWLRRDSARGAGSAADTPVPGDVVPGDVIPAEDAADDDESWTAEPAAAVRVRYTETFRADVTVEAEADPAPEEVPAPDAGRRVPPPPPLPLPPEESRRRMMAARRRLLGMLTILEIAAVALAVLKLAALWVLIPPSIMLIGYALLLREAAHADAERAQREEEAAHARLRAQERARERAAQRAAAARATPAAPAVPAAPPAPAVRYEDTGRDFAPGLAGKYTTSNAEVAGLSDGSDQDYGDEYPLKRLRAVGD
ncbi:hypothetical protein [Trebonia sp.]|uniref:hypothetical protein n=1 Tax=Trebonia sp. TaxID=2767075 RepID=UPI003BAFA568